MRLLPALLLTGILATSCVQVNVQVNPSGNENTNATSNTNAVTTSANANQNANAVVTSTDDDDMKFFSNTQPVAEGQKRVTAKDGSFTIDIPAAWESMELDPTPRALVTLFGPPETRSGGYMYGVTVLPFREGSTQDMMIKEEMARIALMANGTVTIEDAEVNGEPARMQVITKPGEADWLLRTVFVKGVDDVYALSNGAIDEPTFEQFVQSFRWE